MGRRVALIPGEYYHLYNRGVDRRVVFCSNSDHERFISLLYLANGTTHVDLKSQGRTLERALLSPRGEPLVAIGAYCLMPNHFHLLVRELTKNGISKFMQKLATAYTMYFNTLNERSGALFQGKFKAEHASEDRYLKYLFSYIHLNPLKLIDPFWKTKGMSDTYWNYLETFSHSSYKDYIADHRVQKIILNRSEFPLYFPDAKSFKSEIRSWLEHSPYNGSK